MLDTRPGRRGRDSCVGPGQVTVADASKMLRPELFFAPDNLQSLCHSHHSRDRQFDRDGARSGVGRRDRPDRRGAPVAGQFRGGDPGVERVLRRAVADIGRATSQSGAGASYRGRSAIG